ncbi:flagellar basal body-associated FliL family protein [Nocardioides sp. GY 10113]|uniref:flagellar basal body-associated FliL family protein n=1 Tax=Nocardioides sp. GY 10113 TaxID=2569761 RepID=UPI0010A78220|nr:flagellar basal body-associated FliL family protein [Nocardioides sp. GY 10113]TIC83531.1 flagellar basal body-associated FliL family protein [Nocardioides sp. GY 10113]
MTATLSAADATAAPPRKSRIRLILAALVVLALAAGAGYVFLMPADAEKHPEPGEVITLEPIQVNLASGHYLRLGLALQLSADAHGVDGAKALDAAIGLFSGLPMSEVNKGNSREKLRERLQELLEVRYHHEVLEVYFTEFVTQ